MSRQHNSNHNQPGGVQTPRITNPGHAVNMTRTKSSTNRNGLGIKPPTASAVPKPKQSSTRNPNSRSNQPIAVKKTQHGSGQNQNTNGNRPQSATTTTTDKDFVLCLWNNDLPDCDNALVLDVWTRMVQAAQLKHGQHAVKKLTVFELNRVNLAIDRIDGRDIPFSLRPMSKALFDKDGIIDKLLKDPKRDPGFNDDVMKDLNNVRKKHKFNPTTTFMQAPLSKRLVHAMVHNKEIMKELRSEKFKGYDDKACSCSGTTPGCHSCNHKNEWIRNQLNKMVASVDPIDYAEDSIMSGKLVVQDFIKGLEERKILKDEDKFYLDVDGLAEIDAPLERRMEHPAFLVNYDNLVPGYKKVIADTKSSETKKRGDIRALIEKELGDECGRMIDLKGPNRYQIIIDMARKAKRIIMFGGSSMTLLSKLMSVKGLADKIDFVGQGGTSHPEQNLAGNPFNWALNERATGDVLTKHASGTARLNSFHLGTFELGRGAVLEGQDLADYFGSRFGRRVAAFGVQAIKTNPENYLTGGNYARHFTQDGKPVQITCADLVALFAVYAEKTFRNQYCEISTADKMFITWKEEGSVKIGEKTVRVRGASCVKFGTGSAEVGEAWPIKDIIKPWNAKHGAPQCVRKEHLDPIIKECIATFVTEVGKALGPTEPKPEEGGINTRGGSPAPTTGSDAGTPKHVASLASNPPSRDRVTNPRTAPTTQTRSIANDHTADQVRGAKQHDTQGAGTSSHRVNSGSRSQGSGQPGNGHSQSRSAGTGGSSSGRPRGTGGP